MSLVSMETASVSHHQRRRRAAGVPLVAGLDVGEDVGEVDVEAARLQLGEPALGANLRARGDEQFHLRLGRNHRADVAAIENGAAILRREPLLPFEQCLADVAVG